MTKTHIETLELDGSRGEGGGQILRTALSLSMITGTPFRIERIRAGRKKPGLLRQHLTAVNAATEICSGEVSGAELGSPTLHFRPGKIRGGDYRFAIGTAGSCTLVLQTVLPALWFADRESRLLVSGGTHNPAAPPADFLIRSWLPLLRAMGVDMDIELLRHGFYPAGGGEIRARVSPVAGWQALRLETRGEPLAAMAIAIVAGLPGDIAKREVDRANVQLGPLDGEIRMLPAREGPGNVLLIELAYQQVSEIFSVCGERGLPAEAVADRAAKEARRYRDSGAAVGEHLADQLLLPLALASQGSFTTQALSAHFHSNREVIEKFLPVTFGVSEGDKMARVFVEEL